MCELHTRYTTRYMYNPRRKPSTTSLFGLYITTPYTLGPKLWFGSSHALLDVQQPP